MYCDHCGRKISGSAVYCPHCGNKLALSDTTNSGRKKRKSGMQNRNKWPWFIVVILFLLLVVVSGYIWRSIGQESAENTANVSDYVQVTEDTIYVLDENTIETDESTGISYVNNIVIIFFQPGVTKEEVKATVDSIDGEIVGSLDFIDQYQVRVSKSSLNGLKQICEDLEKREEVLFAGYDGAFKVADNSVPNDPWSGSLWSPHRWSEESPEGTNWWLEAVEAPSAWEYNSYFSKIKIGIVDEGFDVGHEDLRNIIKSISPN